MRLLIQLVLCLYLAGPINARAVEILVKDPLGYSFKQYAVMLGIALLGGLVSFAAKVRKGEIATWSVSSLIGELCTSAFAGAIAFWLCEWLNSPPLLTAPMVGMAGHMGTKAIAAFEAFAERRWGQLSGDKQG